MVVCLLLCLTILQLLGALQVVSAGSPLKCSLGSQLCKDGSECIPYRHVCDGESDCKDGSDEEDCATQCDEGQFQCAHGKKCIDLVQVCDGVSHCQDRSDEMHCTKKTESCVHQCDNKSRCLPANFLCDGEKDCLDGTDEVNCDVSAGSPLKCSLGSQLCKDGSECIPYHHMCDGESDCKDGSDEEDCATQCDEGQFQCAHGKKCIDLVQVCDGVSHCQDRSDEMHCTKKTESCVHQCDNKSRCLPANFLCDGEMDCLDGTDEVNCDVSAGSPLKCSLGSQLCKDGSECISYRHVCDGESDCKDGSDEEDCATQCDKGQFQCAHGKKCIDLVQVCDGVSHCQDRSDEMHCTKKTESCVHQCDNKSRCLPANFLCDGEKDCLDGTDEVNCVVSAGSPLKCSLGSQLCKDGSECIPYRHVCDGESDCKDGSDEEDCATQCDKGQFQCAHGKKCIDLVQVCDGVSQCQDRSDEMHCTKKEESCVHQCDNKSRCLPANFLCDGEKDCLDGTDEVNCESEDKEANEDENENGISTTLGPAPTVSLVPASIKCSLSSRPCRDNTECVLYNHVCDGEEDCKDGSDEDECSLTCETGQFQCAHGKKCIDKGQVCDGVPQCQDRSDEMSCTKRMDGCSHQCDDGICIPSSFLCDREMDCLDGTDEADCANKTCSASDFKCTSGQCVLATMRCDGHPDCWDRSDEESCTKTPVCNTKHRCPQSKECLVQEWICDGDQDCADGTDEKDCPVTPLKCGEFQWFCTSKTSCIPTAWKCDGMKDCDDGSDETECGVVACPPHQFQCGSQECLDPALVCNGITNCADGSDEGGRCQDKCPESDNTRCSHSCYSTPQETRCGCAAGFRLMEDRVTCVDIDECKGRHPGVCSQLCINTPGSYQCQCHRGYVMEVDGQHCKITGEPFLLASVQTDLYLFGLRSGSLDMLSCSAKMAILSLDYDWKEQKVFWVSLDSESIRWSSLDQKTKGTLIRDVRSDSVAVDWLGRNLYWIDGVSSQIVAVRLTTATTKSLDHSVILDEDLDQPRSLALLPQKGLMFWTEIGNTVKIERAGMDGSNRRVVVNSSLGWPGGVAVDTISDRVYWTDERLKAIGSATLDGEDIQILQMKETTNPFSLAVFNDMLYWSDAKKRTVQAIHKITGKNRQVLLKRPRQPFGVKIVHPLLQMGIESPCEKMRCSHLCVLAPGPKAVCKCPYGLLLAEDGLTCSNLVNSAFLLMLSPSTVTQIYLQARHTAVEMKGWPEHLALQLPNVNEAAIMDYSLHERTLYLTDGGTTSLSLFKLKEMNLTPRGQLLKLLGDTMTAMSLDWITLNVYWSSTKQPRLQVTSATGTHTAVLIKDNIGGLESVTVHPPSGRVCFINLGLQGTTTLATVECAHMDGAKRGVVWRNAVQPTSLVFSNNGEKIYWADTSSGVIGSIQVDASGYTEFKAGDGLAALALSDDVLLWVTINDQAQVWYRDEQQQQKKLWFEVSTEVISLKAYSKSSQTGSNQCTINNGNCQHLCLVTPRGRTCMCAHDHIPLNTTHCVWGQQCQAGSRPCLDGLSCHPVEKFCNGLVDCPDHSDENCVRLKRGPETKAPTQPPSTPPPALSDAPSLESPTTLNVSSQLRNLEAQECSQSLCGGNGDCVESNGDTSCVCLMGYSGDSCQDHFLKTMQGPIVYGAAALCAGLVVVGILAVVVKRKRRAIPVVKETSMTDLESKAETGPSTQPSPSDPDVAEEVVPSVG